MCMQLLFNHTFTATYSDRFQPSTGDNTDCPCGRTYITRGSLSLPFCNTLHHGLFHCHDRDDARDAHLPFTSLDAIFTSTHGGAALCRYIHASQAFLRPSPPCPDPPWVTSWHGSFPLTSLSVHLYHALYHTTLTYSSTLYLRRRCRLVSVWC